jgi:hypothetical protein
VNGLPKVCFEAGTAILRYTRGESWDETVYNGMFQFDGRYLAHDVEVTHGGKPFLKIRLAKIEPVPQLDTAVLSPPPGSPGPITGPVTVPAFLLASKPVKREFPHFPKGVRGKVTVKFTVNKEGRDIKAEATEGPPDLRKPVEEAVKKSQFQPFLILGKPVEAESTTFYFIQ